VATDRAVLSVMAFNVTREKIIHIDVLMDPDRLDRLSTLRLGGPRRDRHGRAAQ
jgi:hypothetical protein